MLGSLELTPTNFAPILGRIEILQFCHWPYAKQISTRVLRIHISSIFLYPKLSPSENIEVNTVTTINLKYCSEMHKFKNLFPSPTITKTVYRRLQHSEELCPQNLHNSWYLKHVIFYPIWWKPIASFLVL